MKVQEVGAGVADMNDYSVFYLYGQSKKGQTLQEARSLALAEVDKLKRGNFSDDLLPSIINNYKRYYYTELDKNQSVPNNMLMPSSTTRIGGWKLVKSIEYQR